jgi:hypothetical protein
MLIQILKHRLERSLPKSRIWIQKTEVSALRPRDSLIVGRRESKIRRVPYDGDGGWQAIQYGCIRLI